MFKVAIVLLLIVTALAQSGSIQITPNNSILFSSSNYVVNYYTFFNMPSTATFTLNFGSTYITVPNGALNVTALIGTTAVPEATGSCTNSICTLKLNKNLAASNSARFTIGEFRNPYFLRNQSITATITFNATYSQNQVYVIPTEKYTTMAIVSNSLQQSDYGVGNTGVNYIFNFSIPMSPTNVQLSITIPPQVQMGTVQTSLLFYGTPIYVAPVFVNKIVVLTFNTTATNSTDPKGFILLNISGLVNPQSMGNSSSFILQILIPNLPNTYLSCSNCAVAQVSNFLFAQSIVPGYVQTLNIFSSNASIGQANNITIYSKLYASIPPGGIYQILLPSSVKPVLPIYCSNGYGFTIVNNGPPSCSYNSTNNAIYTNNFAFTGSGSVVITMSIVNPQDTTVANFYFQTFDAKANMIGNSSTPYSLSATPQVLTVSAVKSSNQVETSFNLTLNLTLGVALTSSSLIQVILPQANYNTSSIVCSTVVNIQCNSTVDQLSGNLTITLSPPCTQCSVGSVIVFAINGLTNPSYINSYSQALVVQTATTTGIYENNSIVLPLAPSTLTISNYTRSGLNTVGNSYSISFTYTISNYINANGGILLVNFNPNDTYVNPTFDAATTTYTYPTSITVTDAQNNQYSNTITYYTNTNPNSLQKIAIDICGGKACSTTITISGLRKGFSPLSTLSQNIQITTGFGDSVSSSTFNAMQFNVAKAMNTLKLNLSNSVTTLNSNYVIDFVSNNIPFQSGLTFTFSSLHTINGGCFLVHNSTIFDGVFNCQVTGNNSVGLTYTGDITLMMIDIIGYTLTIINVTNPISVVSLSYALSTQFNSAVNQQFTTTYSIQTPLPLSFLYSKTNNTFGQSSTLTVTVVSNYPTFSEIKLSIPSPLMTVLASSSYQSAMINNAYQVTQIYSLVNQSVTISIINPNSTNIIGNIVFSMFSAGSLSATGTISVQAVAPMYLGLSAVTTSRTVGDMSNLTVTFNRVNSYSTETNFLFSFTSSLFDFSAAQYNSAPFSFPISVPIGLSSITITNLKNILFIPLSTPTNSIRAWTVDGSGYMVAISSYTPTTLLPNKAATGVNCALTRTNTAINGVGAVNINYTPRFPTSVSIMTVVMPLNQASIVSPTCTLQGSSNGCSVLFSNSTCISLSYFNQTVTSLTNILNIEPNSNFMSIYMYTSNNQLVQSLSGTISPTIQYNQLSVSGSITSTSVATNNKLILNITSPGPIDIGSKIVINFPANTFLRVSALSNQDCAYTINGVNYTGCQYSVSSSWLVQANLSLLGSSQIPANTNIVLSLFTTNAWSVSSFNALALNLFISNPSDNYVAQGSISLANIYGGIPSLIASSASNVNLVQSSNKAGSNNILTINYTLPVPLTTASTMLLYLPKSAYYLSPTNLAAITNLQSQTENTTHYTLLFSLQCSQSAPLCNQANSQYSFTINLQNSPYVKIINDQFSFQILLGSNPISSQSTLVLSSFVAQTLPSTASLSRSNSIAFNPTNVTISITNPLNVNAFTVIISPLVKATATLPLIITPNSARLLSQPLNYQLNSSNHLIVNATGVSGSTSDIIVSGQNNLLVSTNSQVYGVTVLDANYVYFTGQVSTSSSLTPYSSGLNLQRIITTVGANTNVYLFGTLPAAIPLLGVTFNNNNFTVSGTTFNISLGTIINNNNVSEATNYPITIKNSDFIAYTNTLTVLPSLTTQNLTSLLSFNTPSTVVVSSNFSISLSLNETSLTYISINTPAYFKSLARCCIDAACTQAFIQSCTYTQQSSTNLIQLWLTSSQVLTNVTFVITSLDFQKTFVNQSINIITALPTSSYSSLTSLVIGAANIASTLTLDNWKVNQINTYTLNVQPIAKVGYLSFTLPTYISSQISSNQNVTCTITVNGTVTPSTLSNANGQTTIVIPITFSSGNVSLMLTSVLNPIDNTPYNIIIQQASDQKFNNIFGYSILGIQMKQFDSIAIASAIRVVTKVNSPTNLILQLTAPYNNNQFILSFPSSQIITTQTCSIMVNESQSLPCQVLNSTSIITASLAGSNRYTIAGLQNQKFYDAKTTGDLISAQIGTPYLRAISTPKTSTSISPQLTLGSIVVNSVVTSNNLQLTNTALTYSITIQNTNNINGFILQFSPYYYIFSPALTCSVNSTKIGCTAIDNETLFLPYANSTSNNLIVKIDNIVNFIKPSNWTLKSVQTTLANKSILSFSDVDLYYNDGSALPALMPSALKMRIILPFNHVQPSPVAFSLIIDSQYSSFLPLNLFKLNFTTQDSNCKLLGSKFLSTLSISCSFTSSLNYNMQLQLYHTKYPSVPLSVGTSKVFIYPSPSGSCQNQMCDSCSNVNGQEYCFSCREGLYSSNGQCSGSCQAGFFPYSNTNICQPCSPTCSSCFDLYSTNCLSCKDSSLTLSSGTCVTNCPEGNFAYNSFCVNSQQCTIATGCRLCSNTGFCYQCLPDFRGAPNCKYVNVMPPTIMIYILAPFAILSLVSIIIAAAKCVGAESLLSQTIFSLSFVQLFAWACTVPIMPTVASGMVLISFFTLRIIISIVSYETFYKKNLGELSQKLLEQESQKEIQKQQKNKQGEDKEQKNQLDNWKTRVVRLLAHFNGPDSYELLKSKIAEPVLSVNHSLSIQVIFIINRWLVCFLMFYLLSIATIGDSVIMPLFVIVNASLLCICRLLTVQKVRKCLSCFK